MLAFVAAPALIMCLLLNARPRRALLLYWPTAKQLGLAALLALVLLPPLTAATIAVFRFFPHLTRLLEQHQPLLHELRSLHEGLELEQNWLPLVFSFALLPALCEEIAFRGFILSGLQRRFKPRAAVVLCAFLFALSHMNVFQFLPAFFLGVVLGSLRFVAAASCRRSCFISCTTACCWSVSAPFGRSIFRRASWLSGRRILACAW